MKIKKDYTRERRLIRALAFFSHVTAAAGHACRALARAYELPEVLQELGFVVRTCVQKLYKGYEAIKTTR